MTDWIDQLPQIDAAISDAEWRIGKQKELLGQPAAQEHPAGHTESRRSLELMLTIAAFLRDCRTAVIVRSMSRSQTRH